MSQENAQGEVRVDPETMRILTRHSWPGNVRELENVIERAVILRSGDVITPADLPPNLATTRPESEFDIDRLVPLNTPLPEALERIEELMIRRALEHSGQVQVRAAELLGITKSLLQYKLKKYHLNV